MVLALISAPLPRASQCERARHGFTATAVAADATRTHTQRLSSLVEGHSVAQASAGEDPRVSVRCRLGQRIQEQCIGADLDIQLGPFDRPSPVAQGCAFKSVAIGQRLEARVGFQVFAHVQREVLATYKGQLKDRTWTSLHSPQAGAFHRCHFFHSCNSSSSR